MYKGGDIMTSIRRNQPMITQEQADITPGVHLADFAATGIYNDGIVYVAMPNRGHPGTMGGHFSYKFNVDGPEIDKDLLLWGSVASANMRSVQGLARV
jgi:hypothetical protein